MNKHLKLSLKENAHNFIEDALSNAIAAEEQPERWKFAILSIVQAIELSLKQLLTQEHPLFIYTDIDNPKNTLSLDHAIKRLSTIANRKLSKSQTANFKLSKEEGHALKVAKEARNDITHYTIDTNIIQLKLAFSKLLGFLHAFYDDHFGTALHKEIEENLWKRGMEIQSYGQELQDRVTKKFNDHPELYDALILCPSCKWTGALINKDTSADCNVCGISGNTTPCLTCNTSVFLQSSDISAAADLKQQSDVLCDECSSILEYAPLLGISSATRQILDNMNWAQKLQDDMNWAQKLQDDMNWPQKLLDDMNWPKKLFDKQ